MLSYLHLRFSSGHFSCDFPIKYLYFLSLYTTHIPIVSIIFNTHLNDTGGGANFEAPVVFC
jgi:hypothetical protein